MNAPSWVTWAGALAGAFALGLMAGRADVNRPLGELKASVRHQGAALDALLAETQARAAPAPTLVVPGAPGCVVDTAGLREQIARTIREELRASAATAPAASADDTPSPEAVGALEEGQRLVDGALAEGHWSQAQALTLRSILPRLPSKDGQALRAQLMVASNEGKLATASGPLF